MLIRDDLIDAVSYALTEYSHKSKEEEHMNTREMMNRLKKGMAVKCDCPSVYGVIEAFDYVHMLVGVRPFDAPSYDKLKWFSPDLLTTVDIQSMYPSVFDMKTIEKYCEQDVEFTKLIKTRLNEMCGIEKKINNTYPKPKKVVYNEEAGIMVVIWMDGQKTIVRPAEDEDMNPYDAFCAAYCKRVFGSNSALKRELEKVMVVEKPKTKKKTAPTPTGELSKAIQRIKDAMPISSSFTTPHDN